MSDFLLTAGAITNAINMASVSAEDAPRLRPYLELCRLLGAFAGQLTQAREGAISKVTVEYEGQAAALNHRPLTAAMLSGLMSPLMEGINMVNAAVAARDHGIDVAETVHDRPTEYLTLVRVTVETAGMTRSVSGTLFAGSRPRIVEIKGIKVEADFAPHMLYVTNQDKPGFIGRFGATLAGAGINIATFHLGRAEQGGDAICLVSVDETCARTGAAGDGADAATGDAGDGAGVQARVHANCPVIVPPSGRGVCVPSVLWLPDVERRSRLSGSLGRKECRRLARLTQDEKATAQGFAGIAERTEGWR